MLIFSMYKTWVITRSALVKKYIDFIKKKSALVFDGFRVGKKSEM